MRRETIIYEFLDNPIPSNDDRIFYQLFQQWLKFQLQHLMLLRFKLIGETQRSDAQQRLYTSLDSLFKKNISEKLLTSLLFQYHLQCATQAILKGGETVPGGRLETVEAREEVINAFAKWLEYNDIDNGWAGPHWRNSYVEISGHSIPVTAYNPDLEHILTFVHRESVQLIPASEIFVSTNIVRKALQSIECIWPALAQEIARWACMIVPLAPYPKPLYSFNMRRWTIGGIFLTASEKHPIFVQESIIHEVTHGFLHVVQAFDPLFDISHSTIYEMPWSGNRRSFEDLLHATYIYLMLGRYFVALKDNVDTPKLVIKRLRFIASGFPEAIALLHKSQALTPAGYHFVDVLQTHAEILLSHVGLSSNIRGYRVSVGRFYETYDFGKTPVP